MIIVVLGLNYYYIFISSNKRSTLKSTSPANHLTHNYHTHTHNRLPHNHHNSTRKALMCAIVKDEEAYIDEWVDYHYALGFDKIRIYDNSDLNEMKFYGKKKGDHVDVIHYPGAAPAAECELQRTVYRDCARKAVEEGVYTWAAFFDVDEFLVLKKHEDVHDMLEEHLQRGALAINWYFFEPTQNDVLYSPLPVTKRFMHRTNRSDIIKSIVKLSDFDLGKTDRCYVHNFPLKGGVLHGFNGETFPGIWNREGTEDVAMLHHYKKKSYKEYVRKRLRGRADKDNSTLVKDDIADAQRLFEDALASGHNSTEIEKELVFDDSAWQILKKNVPEYAVFDTLYSTQIERERSQNVSRRAQISQNMPIAGTSKNKSLLQINSTSNN